MYGESTGYWTADGVYQEVPSMEENQSYQYYDEGYLENGEYVDPQKSYLERGSSDQVPQASSSSRFGAATPLTTASAATAPSSTASATSTPGQKPGSSMSFFSKLGISSGLAKLSQLKSEISADKSQLSTPTERYSTPQNFRVDEPDPEPEFDYDTFYEQQRLEEENRRKQEEVRLQKEREYEEQIERQRREKELERQRQEEEKERREMELLEKQRREEEQRRVEEKQRRENEEAERREKELQAQKEAEKQKAAPSFAAPKLGGFNLGGMMSSLTKIASDGISKGKTSLSNLDSSSVLGKDSSIKAFGDALLKSATGQKPQAAADSSTIPGEEDSQVIDPTILYCHGF